jgi:hypothetical protein
MLLAAAAGPGGGLVRALVELLRPAAAASYQEALAAVFTSSAEARRKIKDSAVKSLEEAFGLLQLYERGCEVCQVRPPGGGVGGLCLMFRG